MLQTLSVSFHLTHDCNLRCSYCYTGAKTHVPMSQQTADAGLALIEKLALEQGIPNVEIIFFGGEPLMEKDLIFHILKRCRESSNGLHFSFKMSTNGTLLTEPLMRDLLRNEVFVSLSLDGGPETHGEQRPNCGGHSSYRMVERAIPILLKYIPCANVTCVTTPASAHRLAENVDWIFKKGFRYITTTLDYTANWTPDDMRALEKSYRQLAHWYEEKMRRHERFYLSSFDERIRTHTRPPLQATERCVAGTRQLAIAPNGEIYPCITFVTTERLPQFLLGHVNDGLDDACRSYFHRCSESEKAECAGCSLKSRCSSWCACINFMSTGTVTEASPIVCHQEQVLLPIVDEVAKRLWRRRNTLFMHKHYNDLYPVFEYLDINA